MPFIESDLRQMKDSIKHDREMGNVLGVTLSLDGKEALLARLEAAEKVCEYVEFYWPKGEANLEADLLAWRKAAGKDALDEAKA